MTRTGKRLAGELAAGALALLAAVLILIGFQYQDSRAKMAAFAGAIEAEENRGTAFPLIKGKEKISDEEAEKIMEAYGYKKWADSQYGREFLSRSIGIAIVGGILFFGYAAVLLYELQKRKADREREWLRLGEQLEKIRSGNYKPDYYNDYTEEKLWETRVLDQLDSLCEYLELTMATAFREREETKALVTDISHQLKTPVAALDSCFEILREGNLTPEERLEFEIRLGRQLEGLRNLVEVLVNISRLETGLIEIRPKQAKIFDTILNAVNRVWEKADAKSIEIELEGEEEIENLTIPHDTKWLCEAFLNILENAVKYSPPNTRVLIRVKTWTSILRIEIHDQGIGIPRSEYHKVFQRFYRGKSEQVQGIEGQGVGLYLARKIIGGHYGSVSLDGRQMRKEKGSVFVVQLPYGGKEAV